MNELVELYKKHKSQTHKFISTLTDNENMLKKYTHFKGDGMYFKVDPSNKSFPWSKDQKFRYINKKIDIKQNEESMNTIKNIGKLIFKPLIELQFFNHSKKELDFLIENIFDFALATESDRYQMKTKTSGKTHQNKYMTIDKIIHVNENEINIVMQINFDVVNIVYPIAFHCEGSDVVIFTKDLKIKKPNVFDKQKFNKNDLEKIEKYIRDYIGNIVFKRCYAKELKNFYSEEYDYSMFEESHLELLNAYKF